MAPSVPQAFLLSLLLGGAACSSGTAADAPPCDYNGQRFAAGQSFPSADGCNTCTCASGGVACTERACNDDPCEGVQLPPCPPQCQGGFDIAGQPCDPGNQCTVSAVGDECSCGQDAHWTCSVHPPLGMGCNLTCREPN